MSTTYHIPVLLQESVAALNLKPSGIYVDVTFGGGGHSREILRQLTGGKLFGFDQDPDAAANVPNDDRFTLIPQNFRYMQNFLRMYGVTQVDGILADLGVSSHQLDEGSRGFSLRHDAPLDMRMGQGGTRSAADLLNTAEEDELAQIFKSYGELPGSHRLARTIVLQRSTKPLLTTGDLVALAGRMAHPAKAQKFLAQVFQAVRIAVNDELGALKSLLEQSVPLLAPEGRLAVISYHSLEDRMVKYYMRSGNFDGEVQKDFYGHPIAPFTLVTRSAIAPSEEEISENKRARSARLRVAEKKA